MNRNKNKFYYLWMRVGNGSRGNLNKRFHLFEAKSQKHWLTMTIVISFCPLISVFHFINQSYCYKNSNQDIEKLGFPQIGPRVQVPALSWISSHTRRRLGLIDHDAQSHPKSTQNAINYVGYCELLVQDLVYPIITAGHIS